MATENVTAKKQYSIQETAELLNVPTLEVERWITEGKLGHTTVDGEARISDEDIDLFRSAYYKPPGASL